MAIDLLRDGLVRVGREAPETDDSDLERWALRANLEGETKPLPEPSRKPEGPCRICQERNATAECHQCSREVCTNHLWAMLGLCHACLPEDQLRKARAPTLRPRPDLGIKWVEEGPTP